MNGVPLVVVVVVIDLNSFTESDRVVVAPGNMDAGLETIVGDNINDGDETDTVEVDAVVAGTVDSDVDIEGDADADTVVADGDVDSDDADADVAVSAVADAANSSAAVADDVVADSDVVGIFNFAKVDVEGNFVVENVVLHISSYSFLIFFSRSSSSGLHRAHLVKFEVFCSFTGLNNVHILFERRD